MLPWRLSRTLQSRHKKLRTDSSRVQASPSFFCMQTLGQLLIVNAPMVFDSLFSMSKGLLALATQKKIKVCCVFV